MRALIPIVLSCALLAPSPAWAASANDRFAESIVVGVHAVIALGRVDAASRVGFGVDGWYQVQWYTERSDRFDGEYTAWADERFGGNYGPAAHVWWVDGAWHATVGARAGIAHPLRMGLRGGWWPGPGLAVEGGLLVSTAGYTALDGQVALDAPWVQARLGAAWTGDEIVAERVTVGLFTPLRRPLGWPEVDADVWEPPE